MCEQLVTITVIEMHYTMLSPCQLNYQVLSYMSHFNSPFSSQTKSILKRGTKQTLPDPDRRTFKCKDSYHFLDTHHIIFSMQKLT
jgi:hypothetical protein